MPLRFEIGNKFPSFSLKGEDERVMSFEELSDGMPLLLVFYRGPW